MQISVPLLGQTRIRKYVHNVVCAFASVAARRSAAQSAVLQGIRSASPAWTRVHPRKSAFKFGFGIPPASNVGIQV